MTEQILTSNYAPGLSLEIQVNLGLMRKYVYMSAGELEEPTPNSILKAYTLLAERTPPARNPEEEPERLRFIAEHQGAIILAYQRYLARDAEKKTKSKELIELIQNFRTALKPLLEDKLE